MEPQPWTSYRRNRLVSEVSFSPMPYWSLTPSWLFSGSRWSLKCLLCFYVSCWRLELFYFQPLACVKATVAVVVLAACLALSSVCWGLTLTGPAFLTPCYFNLKITRMNILAEILVLIKHLILPWPQFFFLSCKVAIPHSFLCYIFQVAKENFNTILIHPDKFREILLDKVCSNVSHEFYVQFLAPATEFLPHHALFLADRIQVGRGGYGQTGGRCYWFWPPNRSLPQSDGNWIKFLTFPAKGICGASDVQLVLVGFIELHDAFFHSTNFNDGALTYRWICICRRLFERPRNEMGRLELLVRPLWKFWHFVGRSIGFQKKKKHFVGRGSFACVNEWWIRTYEKYCSSRKITSRLLVIWILSLQAQFRSKNWSGRPERIGVYRNRTESLSQPRVIRLASQLLQTCDREKNLQNPIQ